MPNRIQLLEEEVINQIAAGEVIERPASVLKELVENSLDAGAFRIDVEIEGGGRQLIRVTDDGWGMSRDDALLCLERHATSKITTSEDVLGVRTLGFRGEAIPSIASVSKIRVRTCEEGVLAGTEICISGGRIESVREAGLPRGTQIEVKQLFFNVPGRRKFLRSPETECSHLEHFFETCSLAHPSVAWSYRSDGRMVHSLPAAATALQRIESMRGREWASSLVEVDAAHEGMALRGWVGRAGVSRGSRSDEIWFVNGRPVDSRALYHAIREGYQNALMKGRHPVAVLFLEIPHGSVDVNVHPAKREVRFRDEWGLRRFLAASIRDALQMQQSVPLPVISQPPQRQTPPPQIPQTDSAGAASPPPPTLRTDTAAAAPWTEQRVEPATQQMPELNLPIPRVRPAETSPREMTQFQQMRFRILGVLNKLYLVAECEQGLVLVDQHAAHERVLFEKVLKQKMAGAAMSQRLLVPVTIETDAREADFIRKVSDGLAEIGLVLHEFGRNTFLVDAVPPFFPQHKIKDLTLDILDDLRAAGGETRMKRGLGEDVMTRAVCRMAIKANDSLREKEVHKLLEDLLACDLPYTCPHGRPTMILLGHSELEKKFGRVV